MAISTKKEWENLLAEDSNGNAEAQWEVGSYYDDGLINKDGQQIVAQNIQKALHWYTLSAEQGDESAQRALGVLLSSGEDIKRDIESAINWTQKAIDQGSSCAAHNLGAIYRDLGKLNESFTWYNRAVEMGDMDSLFEIALCYLFGIGTPKNIGKAVNSLKEIINANPASTCERTEENSLYWLAIIKLLEANGTEEAIEKARELLEEANKDEDHEQANNLLNIIGKNKYKIA